MKLQNDFLVADWPAPTQVKTLVSLRAQGDPAENYRPLQKKWNLPHEPLWLNQVHGVEVVDLKEAYPGISGDAIFTQTPGQVCLIQTADCLPIFLTSKEGTIVAAVHAGWRGLAAGIIDETLKRLKLPPQQVLAWLGPAIGPDHFEVGEEVREKFISRHPDYAAGFHAGRDEQHWFADLYHLARINFRHCQIQDVYGGGLCTYCDSERFFSYRRDKGVTGRMVSLIWIW
jgi:YfiH family protein